ncbi:hypothetical protein LOD99_3920 [Oopsacas minuta]|uniref:Transposase n=1 Tax=Oopsacas minuta TaxID=111878 RepID=A0AAV7JVY3_9METZ|nr:hypothetical protein LOD99_3920 [Oopsacas minuta]
MKIGSFFEGAHIPLTELNLGWGEHTLTDWKNFLRDLCVEEFLANLQPIGGPGHIVEIDESKFGHQKYSRGRMLSGQWIFGGIDRETKDIFMIPVQDSSSRYPLNNPTHLYYRHLLFPTHLIPTSLIILSAQSVSCSHCKLDPFHAHYLDRLDVYCKTPVQYFCARDECCSKARNTEKLRQGGWGALRKQGVDMIQSSKKRIKTIERGIM